MRAFFLACACASTRASRCWNASTKQAQAESACVTRLPSCDKDAAEPTPSLELASAALVECTTDKVDTLIAIHNQKAGGSSVKNALIKLCRLCSTWICWFPDGPLADLRRWTDALAPARQAAASYVDRWFSLPQHARDATRVLFADQGRAIAACQHVAGR